jgi:hypothetical protein
MKAKPLYLACALLLAAGSARAVEVTPIYGVSFLGGQYFFSSDKSNLNANVKANVAPAMKFENSNWSLIPMYNGNFRGTKDVTDPVGSSTLFQQGMDHRLAFRGIRQVEGSSWKLKPSLSYKREFLKETRDETWGNGLFDYWTAAFGFEAENVYREPFSIRFGYDFFVTRFPNYQSLESQSGVDPSGQALGRERAGVNTLDTMNHQLSASATWPFPSDDPRMSFSATFRTLYQDYRDQPVINKAGQPSEKGRSDLKKSFGFGVGVPKVYRGGRLRAGYGFNLGVTQNMSNQNTFDAGQTKFFEDSYTYFSVSAGPSANLSWGDKDNPSTAGASFQFSRTQYAGRLAQNAAGAYTDSNQAHNRFHVSLSYGYPVGPNFRLTARTNILRQSSNQKFEQSYRYSYTTANYLLGFTYDY